MADKSFEQRVREEFGQLKMKPDAAVWKNVEAGLNKQKKRRWMVWLFLFAGLAGASLIGYWVIGSNHENGTTARTETVDGKPATESIGKTQQSAGLQSGKPAEETISIKEKEESEKAGNEKEAQPKSEIAPSPKPAPTGKTRNLAAVGSTRVTVAARRNKPADAALALVSDKSQTSIPTKEETTTPPAMGKSDAGITSTETVAQNTGEVKNESIAQQENKDVVEKKDVAPSNPGKDSAATASVVTLAKKSNKKKWQFSVAVDAGKSQLVNTLLPFSFGRAADNVQFSSPGNGASAGLGAASSVPPAVHDAWGFGIQLGAKRAISKKLSFDIVAAYTQFQTQTTVGRRIDSTSYFYTQSSYNTNGYYFVNSDSTQYVNRYHYLRLGANLYTSFKLFKAIPMRWQVGVGASWLVGSNGLHYDPTTRRSFQNNALLTRVQPYFSTGLDFGIGKEPFMYIGPHLLVNAGHLNKAATSGQYLLLSSLQVTFTLPRKK